MWQWTSCQIKTREFRGVMILTLRGRLARDKTAEALRFQVDELLAADKKQILLDLAHLRVINHTGLAALLGIYHATERCGGQLKLSSPHLRVLRALDNALLTPLFEVYGNTGEALASFKAWLFAPHTTTPYITMPTRKSPRVVLSLLMRVRWTSPAGKTWSEETLTEVLNTAGARIKLKHPVELMQEMEIVNLHNREAAPVRVVWVGEHSPQTGQPVGIKFLTPLAAAWCATFSA